MNYLDAVSLINKIETSYDVMSIKYKDVSIWPLLRINIIDSISKDRVGSKSKGNSAVKQVLSTLFYYNPLNLFKVSDIWLFAGNERRKMIDGKYILRVSGGVMECAPNTLVIEKPSPNQSHQDRNKIPEKRIISESWVLLLVHMLSTFIRVFKFKVYQADLLKKILRDNKISFDYTSYLRLFIAQKLVFDFILSISHKPRKVLIECPYTIMGYVWSLHEKGIPVIELQHGVLNDHHYAYNSKYHSSILYPDSIWVFGNEEYNYLTSPSCHYSSNVEKTGLYYMELADKYFKRDVFSEYRKTYNQIILVAGQRGYEEQLAHFINMVAALSPDCLFIYVPRSTNVICTFNQNNILFKPGVNIYEYMKWCDIHCTISSTTCLECQYFQKPTIFYDYDKMATNYYGKVLTTANGVFYIESPILFNSSLKEIECSHFLFKDFFTHYNTDNIIRLLS